MVNKERLIDTFIELGAINSPSGKEAVIAGVLEAELKTLGFDVVRDNAGTHIDGETGNVVGSKQGTVPDAMPIMLSAHMDTVTPTEGWEYRIHGDLIKSRGDMILGADDKAGIAVILEALRVVQEQAIPHGDLQVCFSIAEETGLWGAKYLDYSLVTSKGVFVYDMGRPVGSVTVSAPSHDNILFKVHGKAAHAGARPEDGINAIVVASKAIANMKVGRIDKETTANVGIITGGKARNIVPEFCEVRCEARSRNTEKLDAQTAHMVKCFEDAAAEMGATVEVNVNRSYLGFRLSEKDEVVRIAMDAAKRAGIEVDLHETGGGSDSNIFNAKGLPATVLGVGYDGAHSVDEYIHIPEFIQSAQMCVEIIKVAAGG
jgi:tripeptide aminopeptidase